MKLTPEELAALPERLRIALSSGAVTIEESVKEWEPEGAGYVASLAGRILSAQTLSPEAIAFLRNLGVIRATEQQAIRLSKDRRAYCRQHAYRDQYAPNYVEPPIGEPVYYIVFSDEGPEVDWVSDYRLLNTITMPHWLCEQLVADIKSGRYRL